MKKTFFLCLLTCFAIEVSLISADVTQDAKDKLEQIKEKAANTAKEATKKGKELFEDAKEKVEEKIDEITSDTKNKVRDHVITHVEKTEEFKQLIKNHKNRLLQMKVVNHFDYYSAQAAKKHCIKNQNNFPYRKIKAKSCYKGLREAHKHLINQIKEQKQ